MDAEGVSRLQLLYRISTSQTVVSIVENLGRVGTHAERFVELLWNVEPDDFDSDFPTLEFTLEDLRWIHVPCHLQGVFTVVLEFHRIGD